MFPSLDHNAKRAISSAGFAAWRAGSTQVESGHLLLALVGLAARETEQKDSLLRPYIGDSLSIESLIADIERQIQNRSRPETPSDSSHSAEFKRILVYACEEALQLSYVSAGAEHLLVGILREEGCLAAQILRERGLSPEAVREKLPPCEPNLFPPWLLQRAQQVGDIRGALFGPPLDTILPVTIAPIDSDRASVARFDPLVHSNFDASLRRMELSEPGLEKRRPHAVVLTNHSAMAIAVVVMRWKLTDASGKSKGLISMYDTFYPYSDIPTVAPRSQAAYTPAFRIPSITENCMWSRSDGGIRNPVEAAVTIDTIVFEDGYVVGPDDSQTAAILESRKAAADSLIADVRRAISEQADVAELIENVSNSHDRSKPFEFSKAHLARIMGFGHPGSSDLDLDAALTRLADIPAPPRLFR